MTNDQQAYDRAMAHNAMLRAHASEFVNCNNWEGSRFINATALERLHDTLNATEADVETWLEEKMNGAFNRGAQSAYNAHAELRKEYEQQLATVTNERDALREQLKQQKKNAQAPRIGPSDDFYGYR